jgi:hypothetical protein
MIVSASYKTDIPAFYGKWFLNRLHAGYCLMAHPFDRRKIKRISLVRNDIDGFVFWTKNVGPFLPNLKIVAGMGFPFAIQYTINAYPRTLEYSVTDPTRSIDLAKQIAEEYGPKVLVWRYDPIVFSSATPVESHLDNFEWIASRLEGVTDEVVISFAQIYDKTQRNMDAAGREFGFSWEDPGDTQKRDLARKLLASARCHRMRLTICSQPHLLGSDLEDAHCVDARRFTAMTGVQLNAPMKGSRKECGCFQSVDIGDYDTCPHGCVYCYAVRNRKLAQNRYKQHDPDGEFLFTTDKFLESATPLLFKS